MRPVKAIDTLPAAETAVTPLAPVETPAKVAQPAARAANTGEVPAKRPASPASLELGMPLGTRLLEWMGANWANYLFGVLSMGSVLLVWYLATKYRLDFYIRFGNIPTPGDVFDKVLELNQSPKFLENIGVSVRRILLGFFAAAVLGILLGVLIGRYRTVRRLSLPALELFRPIPAIAWVPMAIMLWPSNEVSIVFITFLGAFFPILLNTIHGVESIDDVLVRAARCLGTREAGLLMYVVLPGALPHIFTGLSVGMGVAWVSLIAAEMISGQFGIGYFTWEAYSLISYAEIALGMITIGALGLVCSGAIRVCARLAMPWISFTNNGSRP